MRKIIRTLLVLSTLFSALFSPSLALAATLTLTSTANNINRGCSFDVKVDLDTQNVRTDGTDALLIYNPNVLSAVTSKIVNGSIYQDYPGNSVDQTTGKVTISGISGFTTPYIGKGTLATVTFTVKDDAPVGKTDIRVDFNENDKGNTTDSNVVENGSVADVLTAVTNTSVTVGTGACGVVATTPPSSSGSGKIIYVPAPGGGPTTPTELPNSGITTPTMIIASVGGFLVILGILGLAVL